MNFDQRKNKGEKAEQFVMDKLRTNGRLLYTPDDGKAHCIDMFAMNDIDKSFVGVEVKTQPVWKRRNGVWVYTFLQRHWNEYVQFMSDYGMDLWLVIVDWKNNKAQCAMFSTLNKIKFVVHGENDLRQYPMLTEPRENHHDNERKVIVPHEWFTDLWYITQDEKKQYEIN